MLLTLEIFADVWLCAGRRGRQYSLREALHHLCLKQLRLLVAGYFLQDAHGVILTRYGGLQFYIGVHIFGFLVLAIHNCGNWERFDVTTIAAAELLLRVSLVVIQVSCDV